MNNDNVCSSPRPRAPIIIIFNANNTRTHVHTLTCCTFEFNSDISLMTRLRRSVCAYRAQSVAFGKLPP